jgi:hypothetical protein
LVIENFHYHEDDWSYSVYDRETPAHDFGVFQELVTLWRSKGVDDKLPAWSDFELEDFVGWYGWVSVADISYTDIIDIHFRLWGTKLPDLQGYELTGKSPRLNTTEPYEYAYGFDQDDFDYYEKIVKQSAIGITEGSVYWDNRSYKRYHEILFPLSDDGYSVDKLMYVVKD